MADITIYQKIVKAGIEFDNHCSDLYIPVTKETTKLIDAYRFKRNVTKFKNQIDGRQFYEVPFAYDEYYKSWGNN